MLLWLSLLQLGLVQRDCLELASFSWTQSYRPCRQDIVLKQKIIYLVCYVILQSRKVLEGRSRLPLWLLPTWAIASAMSQTLIARSRIRIYLDRCYCAPWCTQHSIPPGSVREQ